MVAVGIEVKGRQAFFSSPYPPPPLSLFASVRACICSQDTSNSGVVATFLLRQVCFKKNPLRHLIFGDLHHRQVL